jgi:putative hydrolase of the HAD superfamily
MAIEAVIFDYGGVITTAPFTGLADAEAELGLPAGALARLLFGERRRRASDGTSAHEDFHAAYDGSVEHGPEQPPDWHLLETGRLRLDEFHERATARALAELGRPIDIGFFSEFLAKLSLGIHWMVVQRIRDLREEGYRTGILTNNVREWREEWTASIPMELFDVVVDSSEVGLRKPDPAIFHLACSRLGVTPDRAVFLDDSPGHVRAAEALGLHGVLFANPVDGLATLDRILEETQAA